MAIDDVYAFQLHYTYVGQQCMNTLHFRMKTATDPDTTLFTTLATDWAPTFLPMQVDDCVYSGWLAQQVRGGTVSYTSKPCIRQGGRRLEGPMAALTYGAETADGLPPQNAAVTTLYTSESGRAKRGRHYLGGLSEGQQLNGTITAAVISAYQTRWNAQVAQYKFGGTDANFELGIWSHTIASGCKPNPNPPYKPVFGGNTNPAMAFTAVEGATCRATVYTQRRRTIGVGR